MCIHKENCPQKNDLPPTFTPPPHHHPMFVRLDFPQNTAGPVTPFLPAAPTKKKGRRSTKNKQKPC